MADQQTEKNGVPDRFQTIECLGSGATGAVFHAYDSYLQRDVAIKVLHDGFEPTTVARFQREAQAASRLQHSNVVSVLDFGIHENSRPYLVMEHLNGFDLQFLLEKERKLIQLCDALTHAHSKGVLHRDIKPSNVIIQNKDGEEKLKIVDFGLARLVDKEQSLTTPGVTMGTPYYLSPEAISGKGTDARSDIYSCGCVLFECLTGSPPFISDTINATLMMHLTEVPPALNSKGNNIPVGLEKIVSTALEKDPANRFQTSETLKIALEAELSKLQDQEDIASSVSPKPVTASFDYGHALRNSVHSWRQASSQALKQTRASKISAAAITFGAIVVVSLIGYLTFRMMFSDAMVDAQNVAASNDRSKDPANSPEALSEDSNGLERVREIISRKQKTLTVTPAMDLEQTATLLAAEPFREVKIEDCTVTPKLIEAIIKSQKLRTVTFLNSKGFTNQMLERLGKTSASSISFKNSDIKDSSIAIIANYPSLATLSLEDNPTLNGSGLKYLCKKKKLVRLYLANTGVTVKNLNTFLKHTPEKFRQIHLAKLKLTDDDIRALDFQGCDTVDLSSNPITNNSVSYLASHFPIRQLTLSNCKFLDDGCLEALPKLDLKYLDLSNTNVRKLTGISQNKNLRFLMLDGCQSINDDSLAQFRNMTFEKLNLRKNNITDRGVRYLCALKLEKTRLGTTLDTRDCNRISPNAKERLQAIGIKLTKEKYDTDFEKEMSGLEQ